MVHYVTIDNVLGGFGVSNLPPVDEIFWEVPDGTDPERLYLHGGEIRIKSERPSVYHVWDDDAEVWIDNTISQLPVIKSAALERVNYLTSQVRNRYVTRISGQETVYQLKRAEAERFVADPDPVISNYPLVAAEIGITAPDAYQVAMIYLQLNDIWMQALAALESARLSAVAAIETATSKDAIDAAVASFEASINATGG